MDLPVIIHSNLTYQIARNILDVRDSQLNFTIFLLLKSVYLYYEYVLIFLVIITNVRIFTSKLFLSDKKDVKLKKSLRQTMMTRVK